MRGDVVRSEASQGYRPAGSFVRHRTVSGAGHLHVVCGPMFAGKTSALLRAVAGLRRLNREILVLKPAIDKRYGNAEVVSHDGLRVPAESVTRLPLVPAGVSHVLVDEMQFMTEPHVAGHLPSYVSGLLDRGIDVFACGLDMDWRGAPFPVSEALFEMADSSEVLSGRCSCGAPSTMTFRRHLGPCEAVVLVGGAESYEPRCHPCWQSGMGSH